MNVAGGGGRTQHQKQNNHKAPERKEEVHGMCGRQVEDQGRREKEPNTVRGNGKPGQQLMNGANTVCGFGGGGV